MKKYLSILLLLTIFFSCEKNQPPTCDIISPEVGQNFMVGEIITISIDAEDIDGVIEEVRLYIDNIGITSIESFPYNYNWNTQDEEEGMHFIKAVAIDDGNLKSEHTISVSLEKSSGSELFIDPRDGNMNISL